MTSVSAPAATATTQPRSRTERRKARTAAAILKAAEELFLSRGFSSTTLEDISDSADVAVGSIYAHFGSKDGIYAALIDQALELDKRYCDEGYAAGTTSVERLVGLAEGYLRFAREHPGHFRLFRFPPPDGPGPEAASGPAQRVARRIRDETKRMAKLIGEAVDEGIARPVDPKTTATFLWAAWDGVIACHLGPANMDLSEAEFERVLDRAREVLTLGLLAVPEVGRSAVIECISANGDYGLPSSPPWRERDWTRHERQLSIDGTDGEFPRRGRKWDRFRSRPWDGRMLAALARNHSVSGGLWPCAGD